MKTYLSFDIEASGPVPGLYYMVSLGAVPVSKYSDGVWRVNSEKTFYEVFQPEPDAAEQPSAMKIHGLHRPYLLALGTPPLKAMKNFEKYRKSISPLTCAAKPSSFDFAFLNYYLWKYLGNGSCGFFALDISALAYGLYTNVSGYESLWNDLKKDGYIPYNNPAPHNALEDAIEQAYFLEFLLNKLESKRQEKSSIIALLRKTDNALGKYENGTNLDGGKVASKARDRIWSVAENLGIDL